MLNITTHQGNTNQNHDEITTEDVSIVPIRKKKKKGWQNCRKLGAYARFEKGKILKACKTVSSFLKHVKIEMPYHPGF